MSKARIFPIFVVRLDDVFTLLLQALEESTGLGPEHWNNLPEVQQAVFPEALTRLIFAHPKDSTVYNIFGTHFWGIAISVPDPQKTAEAIKRVFSEAHPTADVTVLEEPFAEHEAWKYVAIKIPALGAAIMIWQDGIATDEALGIFQR
jgi:hypothetical protein